jgi:predicted hydrolase (HD superfamily)
MIPSKEDAAAFLRAHVTDEYQLHHAQMVAMAMEGYAHHFAAAAAPEADAPALPSGGSEDPLLWYVTGLLHDIDFQEHPDTHPAPSLGWFKSWGYPDSMIHAVEAHAYGYHGFNTLPQTRLAAALVACDELTGIFYAYRKMNPVRYGDMKASSLKKKFKDPGFAAKIDRATIQLGCDKLGVPLDEHIANLIRFLAALP